MSQSTRSIVGFSLYEKDSWTILLNQHNGYANEQNFFVAIHPTSTLDDVFEFYFVIFFHGVYTFSKVLRSHTIIIILLSVKMLCYGCFISLKLFVSFAFDVILDEF